MPNLVGIGNSQVPTNAMLGGLAYQDPAHANLTSVEIENIAAIKAKMSGTAVDVFVYDTRKDSDGGAWRHRTQNTSWYNEGASATRGARKEFPAVAVIVATTDTYTIYDGDDHNMSMWMVFESDGSSGARIARSGTSAITMLNGLMCAVRSGSQRAAGFASFIDDTGYQINNTGKYQEIGGWDGLVNRNVTGGWGSVDTSIATTGNGTMYDVAMTVLPNAPIDVSTGLPIPTIAVATNGGVSVIKDDETIFDTVATTSGYVPSRKVEFSDSGEYLYIIQDPSLIYSYKTSSFTTDRSSGTLAGYAGISFFSGYVSGSGAAADTKLARSNDLTINIGHANTGLARLYPDYTYTSNSLDNGSRKMISRITKDFNSGWMVGDIKGAYLADTDDTNITGTELLTNGDFSNGTTGWTERESGGTFTVSGGQATMTYSSGATSWQTTATVVVGKTYTISFDIVSSSIAGIQAYYDNGSGAAAISVAGTGAFKATKTFVATSTSLTIWPRLPSSGNMVLDNFSVREAVDDRTKENQGLQANGTITKTAVATGAELVSYGPFSTSNFLRQPYTGSSTYPSIHHYETGDFHVMFWMNHDGTDAHQSLVGRDNREFAVDVLNNSSYDRAFRIYAHNSSNSLQLMDSNPDPFPLNTWTHVCVNYTNGDTASVYVNGVINKTGALDYDIDDTTNGLNIGCRNTSGSYAHGATATKLSLVRIGGTAPSPEQIEKIYKDEEKLFAPNAKCTLYGSSDAVTGVAYDDSNDTVHVGTSAGRSDFVGLNRINNTTTAVTTAISASNGLVAEQ